MKLHFEYSPTFEDYFALAQITASPAYQAHKKAVFSQAFIWIPLFCLGIYLSIVSPFPAIVCIYLGALAGYIYDLTQIKNRYWDAVKPFIRVPKGKITLDLSEEGLHETCEQIQSFAPWSCVTRHFISRERIMIELSSSLWAIIPAAGLSPDSSALSDLEAALSTHAKGTEQGAAANP